MEVGCIGLVERVRSTVSLRLLGLVLLVVVFAEAIDERKLDAVADLDLPARAAELDDAVDLVDARLELRLARLDQGHVDDQHYAELLGRGVARELVVRERRESVARGADQDLRDVVLAGRVAVLRAFGDGVSDAVRGRVNDDLVFAPGLALRIEPPARKSISEAQLRR